MCDRVYEGLGWRPPLFGKLLAPNVVAVGRPVECAQVEGMLVHAGWGSDIHAGSLEALPPFGVRSNGTCGIACMVAGECV